MVAEQEGQCLCEGLRSVVAEHVFVQEWNELEDEFEIEKCGDMKIKSRLKDAGARTLEGVVSASTSEKPKRQWKGGKDHAR